MHGAGIGLGRIDPGGDICRIGPNPDKVLEVECGPSPVSQAVALLEGATHTRVIEHIQADRVGIATGTRPGFHINALQREGHGWWRKIHIIGVDGGVDGATAGSGLHTNAVEIADVADDMVADGDCDVSVTLGDHLHATGHGGAVDVVVVEDTRHSGAANVGDIETETPSVECAGIRHVEGESAGVEAADIDTDAADGLYIDIVDDCIQSAARGSEKLCTILSADEGVLTHRIVEDDAHVGTVGCFNGMLSPKVPATGMEKLQSSKVMMSVGAAGAATDADVF